MDPMTLIVIVVLAIVLVYVVTSGGMAEPGRTIIIAVLAIALLVALLRMLGLF
jgi:hypothetical protein